ncbi:MAG: hypothetical protein VB858_01065 [Planctomycetaceae bacterium]
MELLSNPSDDQIAAIGCFLAFVISGGLMYVSFFLRSSDRQSHNSSPVSFESVQQETQKQAQSPRKAA